MKFIVITAPDFLPDEAAYIMRLFDWGVDTIHLRKPGASREACAALLASIASGYRARMVTHDHFGLCREFGLRGVHLNGRNPLLPAGHSGSVSCSCHSLEEAVRRKSEVDYLFLSPIFDSISKQGYTAVYSRQSLDEAAAAGVIDPKVVALGGVSANRISQLRDWHFGGAAFLGDIWNRMDQSEAETYVRRLRRLL